MPVLLSGLLVMQVMGTVQFVYSIHGGAVSWAHILERFILILPAISFESVCIKSFAKIVRELPQAPIG